MMETEFSIDFVKLESGKVPFIQFLDSLTLIEKAEVLSMIEEFRLIKTNCDNLPKSLSRNLRDGIFELRVRHTNKISRSLYFFLKDKKIIFTNGFVKKTEKTPNEEIEKAIKYRSIYKESI